MTPERCAQKQWYSKATARARCVPKRTARRSAGSPVNLNSCNLSPRSVILRLELESSSTQGTANPTHFQASRLLLSYLTLPAPATTGNCMLVCEQNDSCWYCPQSLLAMQGSASGSNVRYYPTWKHSPLKERNERGFYSIGYHHEVEPISKTKKIITVTTYYIMDF
jgi:hypothetical protein